MAERLVCPTEFQERINSRFGMNRYGAPNYRIVWSETETTLVAGKEGYEERLLCSGVPCWNILQWNPPERYGTPESWELSNKDPETGLLLLGPYPAKGRYEVVMPLYHKSMVNGKLKVDILPLCNMVIDTILPLLAIARDISAIELKILREQQKEQEEKALVTEIADRLADDLPLFYGPVSYEGQQNRTALIDRKMAEIEKVWRSIPEHVLRNMKKGFRQLH